MSGRRDRNRALVLAVRALAALAGLITRILDGNADVMPRTTPKLPFAFLRAGDPQLTISDNDWQRIENAYGQSLSARHSRYCDVDASCFKTLLDFFWPPAIAQAHALRRNKILLFFAPRTRTD